MEGQLKKKGGLFGGSSWKDRYFVLDGRALCFFAGGSTEGQPEGEVTVAGVHACNNLQGRAQGFKPNRFDFAVEGGGLLCVSAPSACSRRASSCSQHACN